MRPHGVRAGRPRRGSSAARRASATGAERALRSARLQPAHASAAPAAGALTLALAGGAAARASARLSHAARVQALGPRCRALSQSRLQDCVNGATCPRSWPPRQVIPQPRAYGVVTVLERRRGRCGAALKQARGLVGPVPGGSPAWGALRWGSPAGSATRLPDGVVKSASTWRDEVGWWREGEGARARGGPGAPGPRPASPGGAAGPARAAAGERGARASGAAPGPAPGLPPAAELDRELGFRSIVAMELCEAGARARAGTLGGAAPPETGRARPWRGLRAWPEDERACGGGWARVRARPRPRARPAPQARIDAGHRAPGPGARSLRDTHAARSGTLERALQRGLLHARRSCRPRLLLLLGLALDVARALAHLHAPGGLVRPRPQTPAEHAQACSAGRRAEGPGPPLALRLPAARAAARAQGTAARARDCACSAAGRLARTTEGRRVLAGTTCGGGADAAGEGAGWRRVSVRSRGGRAGARRHRVQQRAAHQAGRLRRAGRGPAAGQGARPAACSALRAALLPSCQGASAGRGARARAARRPACSLPACAGRWLRARAHRTPAERLYARARCRGASGRRPRSAPRTPAQRPPCCLGRLRRRPQGPGQQAGWRARPAARSRARRAAPLRWPTLGARGPRPCASPSSRGGEARSRTRRRRSWSAAR
jgi:hypothetical protein